MNNDKIFCYNFNYQRFMSEDEKKKHPGQNAYCLLAEDRCQYYIKYKTIDFCTYSLPKVKNAGI